VEAVDLGPRAVFHHQNPASCEARQHERGTHAPVGAEEALESLDVLGLLPKIHLRPHPDAEFPDHVRHRTDMVVREEDVQPEQEPERDIQIQGHPRLDAGA
jgi:hypothetical protein